MLGHCVNYIEEALTWADDQKACAEQTSRGELVKLSSEEDNEDMRDIVGRESSVAVWIGASNTDGDWKWNGGSSVTWSPPGTDLASGTHLLFEGGDWKPGDASETYHYMFSVQMQFCDGAFGKVT